MPPLAGLNDFMICFLQRCRTYGAAKPNAALDAETAGTFVIQQSADGVTFTPLRTVTNKDNTDQSFSDTLALDTRFVAFVYSEKISGNIQFDKLSISAAPPYEAWASTFALTGADADALNDYDHDGASNLMEYATGGSPITADATLHQALLEKPSGKLRLTAILRTSDAALDYAAQTNTVLSNPNGWTITGVALLTLMDQTGVPAGFERAVFEADDNGESQRFFRLQIQLTPERNKSRKKPFQDLWNGGRGGI